ncbi:MAG: hypothetical protein ILP24_00400, partial [Paludibacteraceae bacterium]|nr:hypothetical protein [Paludibacteraceae bacterium]
CASNSDVSKNYNAIQTEVIPQFRSTLIADLIIWFAKKGDVSYKSALTEMMSQIEKISQDSMLQTVVKEYGPFYSLSGTVLPDSVLDNTH